MEWNGMEWNGIEWNGIKLEWNATAFMRNSNSLQPPGPPPPIAFLTAPSGPALGPSSFKVSLATPPNLEPFIDPLAPSPARPLTMRGGATPQRIQRRGKAPVIQLCGMCHRCRRHITLHPPSARNEPSIRQ